MFDVDQLHQQLVLGDHLAAAVELGPLAPPHVVPQSGVVVVGDPQNFPDPLLTVEKEVGAPKPGRGFAPLHAAARPDDDRALRTSFCGPLDVNSPTRRIRP